MTNILRFESYWSKDAADVLCDEAARITSSPLVIALIVEGPAMKLVRSTLGDGVYNTSR
jgi:hypothetical protein